MELIEVILIFIIILFFLFILVVYLATKEKRLLSKQRLLNKILHLVFNAGQSASWEYNELTEKYSIHENIWESLGLDTSKTVSIPVTRNDFLSIVHPDDINKLWNSEGTFKNFFEGNKEYRINPFLFENKWIWVRDYFTSIELKSSHQKRYWIGYVQNITEEKRKREELELKEEQFSSLFKVAPLGIALFDKEGALVTINDKVREIFGAPNVLQGLKHLNLFTSEYFTDTQKKQLKQNKHIRVTINYNFDQAKEQKKFDTTRSGTRKMNLEVIPNTWHNSDEILGYYMIIEDITKSASFLDSYKQMLSFTKSALWEYFPEENCFMGDEQYSKISGLPCSEDGEVYTSLDKAIEVIHPDDRNNFVQFLKNCSTKENGTHNYFHQFRIIKNGNVRYIDNYLHQVINNKTLVLCKGISQDVTTRMVYEEAIHRVTQKASPYTGEKYIRVMIRGFIELIGAKGGGVFRFNKDTDRVKEYLLYSMVNKKWEQQKTECIAQLERMFVDMAKTNRQFHGIVSVSSLQGCLREQLDKKNIKTLLFQKMISSTNESLGYFLIMFEGKITNYDSSQNALSLLTNKITTEFEHIQTLEELKEVALKADEAAKAKEVFLSTISHELRTPLNSILGFTSLLQKEQDFSPKVKKYLQTIQQSSKALDTILMNIVEVARSTPTNGDLHLEATNICSAITDVKNLFAIPMQEKGLQFSGQISENCPLVYIDKTKFQRILMNLIGNASRYTKEGFIQVITKKAPPILDDSILEAGCCTPEMYTALFVSVVDSGPGIPENQLKSIFEPFKQCHNCNTKQEGIGLGLAICKKLASDMNATLTVESTVGEGSTFTLYFPSLKKELFDSEEYSNTFSNSVSYSGMESPIAKHISNEDRVREFSYRFGSPLRALRRGLRISLINPLANNIMIFAKEYQWEEIFDLATKLQKAVYLLNLEDVEDYLHYFRSILVIQNDSFESRTEK